jgi:hypothetical protein
MRKVLGVVSAMALALLAGEPAHSRQAKVPSCPMTVKQPAKYCEKCMMVIDPKEIKDGKCSKDQTSLVTVQVCVKDHYICGCGKSCCTDDKDKPGNCKCSKPLKKESNTSLISYTCATCAATSPIKDKVMHKDDCKKKDVKMACGH